MKSHFPHQLRRIRLLLQGPSGSGKAFRALLIAKGLAAGQWPRVVVVDTSHGTAGRFPELGPYRTLPLAAPHTPERYLEALACCEAAGAEVIVFNSLSACQEHLLQALANLPDNSFTAWGEATRPYYTLLNRVLTSPAHIIASVRTQAGCWQASENARLELAADDTQGVLGELAHGFTLMLDFERPQYAIAHQDRTHLFGGRPSFRPGSATGQRLRDWCQSDEFPPDPTIAALALHLEQCTSLAALADFDLTLTAAQRHHLQPAFQRQKHHLLRSPHFSHLQPTPVHHHGNLPHAA